MPLYEGVGIACKIDDILDGELYSEIIRHELMDTIDYYDMDSAEIIFQQDSDPKHLSSRAQDALDEVGIEALDWPAQSPDLNPMEHYWKHLKKQMRDRKKIYATKEELWEALQEELDVVNKDLCQKLIASMPERVQAVIKAKGGYTKY